jgi:hypothetical protein
MRIPTYLFAAQWALLFGLGLLVVVMYRQLGHVFGAKPPREHGPAAGTGAPGFEYKRVSDGTLHHFEPGRGRPALLAFVNPTCLTCEQLVASMSRTGRAGGLDAVRVILVMSDPVAYLQVSEAFREASLEIGRVTTMTTISAYRAEATPLLVAIDGDGVIRSAGAAVKEDEIRRFVQACLAPPPAAMLNIAPAAVHSHQGETAHHHAGVPVDAPATSVSEGEAGQGL